MVAKVLHVRKRKGSARVKKVLGWSLLVFIGLLGLVLVFINVRLYQKRTELQLGAQELQAEIQDLSQRKQALQHQLDVSVTTEYEERVLREQGLYQKPGEEVVTILSGEEPEVQEQKEKAWWKPWTWFSRE